MTKRDRLNTKRVNIFDGQKLSEGDLDAEQLNNNALASNIVLDFHGSGVVKNSPFEDNILLDTSRPGYYADNETIEVFSEGTYDGKGLVLDLQPSDSIYGNRLEFEMVNLNSIGRHKPKIMVIGKTFDGLNSNGSYTIEFLEFGKNEKLVTQNFYQSVIGLIINNFAGGLGKTYNDSSAISVNNINDNNGYLIVREAKPLSVYPQTVVSSQTYSPNYDIINFISSDVTRTIQDEIEDLLGAESSISEFYLDFDGKEQVTFDVDGAVVTSYGQKFLSKANNLQRIDLLLSVVRDEDADLEDQLNWSGDLVVSVHELLNEVTCSTNAVPDDLIDFDPDINPLIEISYSQSDLEALGYKLNETAQVVSFNFAGTLIADPNMGPTLEKDKYYAFIITRRGDNRTGTVVLEKGYDKVSQKANLGITLTTLEQFQKQESKFFEYDAVSKRYVNDSESSLWFKIHADTVEVTDGTAYTDYGIAVNIPKTEEYVGNAVISHFERNISLNNVSEGTSNFLILSQKEQFSESDIHPVTKNHIFTRIHDAADLIMVSNAELAELTQQSTPLILSKITDTNVRDAQVINGQFEYPGQVGISHIKLVTPGTSITASNLINRIIIPDTSCSCNAKYRIIDASCEILKVGDFNNDGFINSTDLGELSQLIGHAFNSNTTQKQIFNGDIDFENIIQADVNQDGLIDGLDIEILEDAVDGYVNFTGPEEFTIITLTLENVLEEDDYPILFTDAADTGVTTAASATITFTTTTLQQALAIRIDDIIEVESTVVDAGEYVIASKTIATNGLDVTVTVTNTDGTVPVFSGSTTFNPVVTSGSKVNLYADNLDLLALPFENITYRIDFIEAPFESKFINICDLRRDIGTSFIEEQATECIPTEQTCLSEIDCEPKYKNQTYLPGDLYLPNGNILTAPGTPHPGDFEFVNITIPIPAGDIDDCSINLYNNFIKSYNSTALTASGYDAMRYSDGTLVGCTDTSTQTDLTRGRVKFDQSIASIYVDALTDGYQDGYQEIVEAEEIESSIEDVYETFIGRYYTDFDDWTENVLNDTGITNITHAASQSAIFDITTSTDSNEKIGRLDSPVAAQDFTGDFIVDFIAKRTAWSDGEISTGRVYSNGLLEVTNDDGSIATLKFGWRLYGGYQTKLFYSGIIVDSGAVTLSSFDFEINAPDNVNDEVLFRLRRTNDVISAYYIIPSRLTESTSNSFGQYVKVGTNPEMQPGSGSASFSYEIAQSASPTAGQSYYTRLMDVKIKSSYSSDNDNDTIIIGRNSSTNVFQQGTFTIPFNLPRRTTIVSATIDMISKTTDTISGVFEIIPYDLLNMDNIGRIFNVPLESNVSYHESFSPGSIVDGQAFSVDITTTFINLLSTAGNLPGFIKGFLITPATSTNSSFEIESDITLTVVYSDVTTGVVFKIGATIDQSTGIVTLNTKNILYDNLTAINRTVLNFGVYLKKSGFRNNNVNISIADLKRLGIGTCFNEQDLTEDEYCYFVVGSTTVGTFVGGPYECSQ